MNALRKLVPIYVTGLVIAASIAVGFILGTMNATIMAKQGIAEFGQFVRAAIVEERGK